MTSNIETPITSRLANALRGVIDKGVGGKAWAGHDESAEAVREAVVVLGAYESAKAAHVPTHVPTGPVPIPSFDYLCDMAIGTAGASGAITSALARALGSMRDFTHSALAGTTHDENLQHFDGIATAALDRYNRALVENSRELKLAVVDEHASEPWVVDIDLPAHFPEDGRTEIVIEIVDAERGTTPCYATSAKDARRIAACINACAGIPVERLERLAAVAGGGLSLALAACDGMYEDVGGAAVLESDGLSDIPNDDCYSAISSNADALARIARTRDD